MQILIFQNIWICNYCSIVGPWRCRQKNGD